MTFSRLKRLVRFVPPFLRKRFALVWVPGTPYSPLLILLGACTTSFDEICEDIQQLRARGAANRFAGEFGDYYSSEQRKEDVARLGMSRLLSKRTNESWIQFEERVRAFTGAEVWDGTKRRYTVTGDVAKWGCFSGIKLELERTGLVVDSIYGARGDPVRWRVLTVATMAGQRDTNFSMILDVGTPKPPNQRLTKIYTVVGGLWTIWIKLMNPGVVDYSEEEVKEIVKLTKPAWVRAFVLFPGATVWVEVY